MKIILTVLMVIFMQLNADEIQRIESMVENISKLRSDYSLTQVKLEKCTAKLHNNFTTESDYRKKEKEYINRIVNLKNQLKKAKKTVVIKENNKSKNQVKLKVCLDNQKIESDNEFPELKMKKEFVDQNSETLFFKASSFRVNHEAKIYDGVNSKVIDIWENRTSFTSNQRQGKWIKITGYFLDKEWKATTKEMWVKNCDVINRSEVTK